MAAKGLPVVLARGDECVNEALARRLRREAERGEVVVGHADAALRGGVLGRKAVHVVGERAVDGGVGNRCRDGGHKVVCRERVHIVPKVLIALRAALIIYRAVAVRLAVDPTILKKEVRLVRVVHDGALRLEPLEREFHIMVDKAAVREAGRLEAAAVLDGRRLARCVAAVVAVEPRCAVNTPVQTD
jgi:hypothetical protein